MDVNQLLKDYRMHISTAMSSSGEKRRWAWDGADACAREIAKAFDALKDENAQLRTLAETQAQVISRKTDEIDALSAAL